MKDVNRRQVLLSMGLGGVALFSGSWLRHALSSATLHKIEQSSWALGSDVSLLLLHENKQQAQRAVDAAFMELDLVENIMSLYRDDSEICRLNKQGVLHHPHPYLKQVLKKAQEISALSDGAFDVTVQPLWAGHRDHVKDLTASKKLVNWKNVVVEEDKIYFKKSDMAITLNGIAQGFAGDCVKAVLQSYGVEHAICNMGELSAWGQSEEQSDWKVGLQHPRRQDAYEVVTELKNRCLATSGDYASQFSSLRHHHLFNPASGQSANHFQSVTVLAPTGLEADALSTALFVAGVERAQKIVATLPEVEAYFVLKDGRRLRSKNFPVMA